MSNNKPQYYSAELNSQLKKYLFEKLQSLPPELSVIDRLSYEYFAISHYMRTQAFTQLKNMKLSEFNEQFERLDYNEQLRTATLIFLSPIRDALMYFNKYFTFLEKSKSIQSSPELKQLLKQEGIDYVVDLTLKDKLRDAIIDKYTKMKNQALFFSEDKDLFEVIKLISIDIFISLVNEKNCDTEIIRTIGEQAKLFSNDILLEIPHIPEQITIHPLLNINELLKKFEDNSITEKEKHQLLLSDYIIGLIRNLKNNNQENISMYLQKLKSKDIAKVLCELFKNNTINYADFIMTLENPYINENRPDLKKNIKKYIKGMLDIIYDPLTQGITQIFSYIQIYELTQLGYVSDIDLIKAFKKQESLSSSIVGFDALYDEKYNTSESLIKKSEILKHFDAKRLLDNYFKPKNSNLQEIFMFYREYILHLKTIEEFTEFENEILKNSRIKDIDIVTLFINGCISTDKLKELMSQNSTLKLLLYNNIKDKYKNNKFFLLNLILDEILTPNEVISIVGQEEYKQIMKNLFSELNIESDNNEYIEYLSKLGFLKMYDEFNFLEGFEKDILSKRDLKPYEVFMHYTNGCIKNEKFIELKEKSKEIQEELYEFIKSQYCDENNEEINIVGIPSIIYLINNGVIDEFELIEILGDGEFEKLVKQGLTYKYIKPEDFEKISFIDKQLLLGMYEEDKYEKDDTSDTIDFKYILQIYISTSNYISLNDIKKIVGSMLESHCIPSDFTNLSNYIYQAIREAATINMQKIEELYLNNYLIFSDLSKLVDEGIISSKDAQAINQKFCTLEKLEELRNLDMNLGSKRKNTTPESNIRYDENFLPKGRKNQIKQANLMIEILQSMGYTPKTSTNLFNLEIMDTFEDEELKDYRVFISEKNPSAIILVHCIQAGSSNIYYRSGESKSYVVPASDFYNYLTAKGEGVGISAKELTDLQTTKTVYIGKTWQNDLISSIEQINNMLNETILQEQQRKGARETKIETEISDNKDAK